MRAVRYHEHGGPEVLRVEEVDRPKPGPDEVRVAVEAAAINPVDTYFREGAYEPGSLPWIPGSDVAGVVDAVGETVTDYEPGDRVFATGLGKTHQGTCAEYVAVPTDLLAALPDGVDFDVGAALGVAGVTSWLALVEYASLEPAERCLIHGGSGGVGHVAVQVAVAAGADVTTTASPEYHDRLEDLGAETVLDYGRADLADAVREAGEPDAILDHRLDDYLQFDADVAAQGARVVGIGNSGPEASFSNVPAARAKDLEFRFMVMYNSSAIAESLERLARLAERGDLIAAVARTYDLESVDEAQRAVLEESVFGKLVVEP